MGCWLRKRCRRSDHTQTTPDSILHRTRTCQKMARWAAPTDSSSDSSGQTYDDDTPALSCRRHLATQCRVTSSSVVLRCVLGTSPARWPTRTIYHIVSTQYWNQDTPALSTTQLYSACAVTLCCFGQ